MRKTILFTALMTSSQLLAFSQGNGSIQTFKDYWQLSEGLTNAENTPIITQSTSEATALSSPVAYKPYICGTGARVLNSDGQGDAYIRFAPGTFNSGNGGSNDLAMYGSFKPGGDAQYARWPVIAGFTTSSNNSIIEVGCYSLDNNDQIFPLIEVNGNLVSDVKIRRTVTGNGWKFTLTFPSAAARAIKLYCDGSMGLLAIRVPTGQSIAKPAAPAKTIAFIGDSFCAGAGIGFNNGAGIFETFARRLGKYMGGDSFLFAGIGGTGFTAGGGTNKYLTRAAYVSGKSPNILIVNGSINDGTGAGTVAADVAAFLAACSTIPRIIVIGTMVEQYEANHDAVKAAALLAGAEFIDMRTFLSITQNPAYFYSDGVHPSTEGQKAIAISAFRKIGVYGLNPLEDPDGDGLSNLMEYALGLDPNVASTTGTPKAVIYPLNNQKYLALEYSPNLSATGISYLVEVSGDLQTWNSGATWTETVQTGATVVVRDLLAQSSGLKRFLRLRVTQ